MSPSGQVAEGGFELREPSSGVSVLMYVAGGGGIWFGVGGGKPGVGLDLSGWGGLLASQVGELWEPGHRWAGGVCPCSVVLDGVQMRAKGLGMGGGWGGRLSGYLGRKMGTNHPADR